jgi:hypothetical protein
MTEAKSPLIVVQPGPRNAYVGSDGLRFYRWNGVDYPSVTSIRKMAGQSINLVQWQINQVIARAMTEHDTLEKMLRESPEAATASWLRKATTAARDAAANVGTQVHDAAAAGLRLDQVGPEVAPMLRQYRSWIDDTGANVLVAEKQVFNLTVGYAGTFDMIARFPNGQLWMIDLKTGKGTYPDHALQLEAYARAEIVGEDDQIDRDATEYLKQVTGRAILHLQPEGWTFKVIPQSNETWVAFRGLLAFARWMYDHPAIDTLISAQKSGTAT